MKGYQLYDRSQMQAVLRICFVCQRMWFFTNPQRVICIAREQKEKKTTNSTRVDGLRLLDGTGSTASTD